ncbi:hypothetical protein [Rubripirellula reticaptiva]|uniref:hypothetical protein n=1 Tax=Rubripirellula reticaptiva TaxID=2528013 RepID=UPI001C958F81|nr:hypothetical protein [Rubripirellula reticaptiva]
MGRTHHLWSSTKLITERHASPGTRERYLASGTRDSHPPVHAMVIRYTPVVKVVDIDMRSDKATDIDQASHAKRWWRASVLGFRYHIADDFQTDRLFIRSSNFDRACLPILRDYGWRRDNNQVVRNGTGLEDHLRSNRGLKVSRRGVLRPYVRRGGMCWNGLVACICQLAENESKGEQAWQDEKLSHLEILAFIERAEKEKEKEKEKETVSCRV